jgi:lysozyme
MTGIDRQVLVEQLLRHEAYRRHPYRCSSGRLTCGIGRNLEDRGITLKEAIYLLNNDIDDFAAQLTKALPWVGGLSPVRQSVLVNMAFNMGLQNLLKFSRMLAALRAGNYAEAADEMLDSRWAQQVRQRAIELARQMEVG